MPQAAPQGQKTMDEALQETIAAHEEAAPEKEPASEPQEGAGEQVEAAAPEGQEPKEDAESEEKTEPAKPTQPQAAKERKENKAPAAKPIPALSSWPPHLREQFHTLPRGVKDQIIKSQGDYARGLAERDRQISAARQQVEAFKPIAEAISPFSQHLERIGVPAPRMVKDLLGTEYVLRAGNDAERAQVVARLMGAYNVTPAALVAVLKGEPVSEEQERPAPRQQQVRDPEFQAFKTNLLSHAQKQKAAREQKEKAAQAEREAKDEAELNEFLNSGEAEFFDDVHPTMARLSAAAQLAGEKPSWKELYDQACLLNEDVRTVLEKRKADQASLLRSKQAQQARKAASSVKTEPGAPQGARKSSMMDELRRKVEAHYGPQT